MINNIFEFTRKVILDVARETILLSAESNGPCLHNTIMYYVALSIFLTKYLDIIAVSEIGTILGDLTGIPKECFFGFSSKYFRCTMYFYVGNLFCFALRLRPLELQVHRI